MAASTSIPLSPTSQTAFQQFYKNTQLLQSSFRSNMRTRMEAIDKAYQREVDESTEHKRAKNANAAGDTSRFQNVTVPVVMPQVETSVAYQTSVFLTGHPLFGVVASPQFIDEAIQLETIIEENSVRGGWVRELMLFFRNGEKYNFAPLEVTWDSEVTPAIETSLQTSIKEGKPKEVIWSGNKLRALDPYNTFVDPRVLPTEIYKIGEFAGYTEYMNRIQLKMFVAKLPDKIIGNLDKAYASRIGTAAVNADSGGHYVPTINKVVNEVDVKGEGTNWMSWAGLANTKSRFDYKDTYEVTTLYARVMPSEFGLTVPSSNTPQVYKLILINHEHIIYCERQTNAHGYIPILIGQPNEDGLGYQTKSKATNAQPFQEVASAYMNSILHSRRRAVTDRVLYDPSRITSNHINSDNPSAKIPVRPAAYGKNVAESVYQFPYREDQAGFSMQQIQQLLGLANQLNGQNQASQGQFVKGNKTLHEFDTVMSNSSGRDQMSSILYEAQIFTPLKEILKINILQYQGGTTIYNRDKKVAVEIDPIALRKSILEFKVSDGLIPADKLINADTFSVAMQVFGSSPQISAGYNVAQFFSYMMKTQGGDVSEFEKSAEQQAYEQAMGAWERMSMLAIEKGIDPEKLPPQPKPEEFGYVPAQNKPAPDKQGGTETETEETL